ncbi:glycosyltransferase family 4 protein [Tessaracoccus antarcticus]|nr:glycosyltransferase family 4 protein [Tessaracoccus antarcticus]
MPDMHVALVCPYSLDAPGGVGTHVMGLAGWLAGRGQRVTVIAPGRRARPAPPGVIFHLVGPSSDFHFNGSVAQLAVRRRQCADALRTSLAADVVHVHEPLTPGIAFAVAKGATTLVVTHHASFRVPTMLAGALRWRARALGERQSIAVSRAAAATARRACGAEPVIIGNGVVLPPAPAPRAGWRGGARPRVGFLGRLDEPRKGFDVFREVADLAAQEGLDAEFVALGPGSVTAGRVKLWGVVDDATRDQALQSVDCLVAPNLFGESFGMVLVEALASGCDVVASDLAGFRDVLAAAGTGAVFPVGDSRAALAILGERLARPTDPTRLHASAQQWGWDVLGPRVLAQYEVALARANTPPGHRGARVDGLGWHV